MSRSLRVGPRAMRPAKLASVMGSLTAQVGGMPGSDVETVDGVTIALSMMGGFDRLRTRVKSEGEE